MIHKIDLANGHCIQVLIDGCKARKYISSDSEYKRNPILDVNEDGKIRKIMQ